MSHVYLLSCTCLIAFYRRRRNRHFQIPHPPTMHRLIPSGVVVILPNEMLNRPPVSEYFATGSASSDPYGGPTTTERRSRYLNQQTKSLSTESAMSSASSKGSDNTQQQAAAAAAAAASAAGGTLSKMMGMGGSYSASTGSSSKIVDMWGPALGRTGTQQPRLAVVAAALLKAKAAGQLPSALKSVKKETEAYSDKLKVDTGENGNAVQPQSPGGPQQQAMPQRPPRGGGPPGTAGGPPSPAPRRMQQQQQ
jgi:hypothetical protein